VNESNEKKNRMTHQWEKANEEFKQQSGKKEEKAQRTTFEEPTMLQTTKVSKQQENEQQRDLLVLIPRNPVSPTTATCIQSRNPPPLAGHSSTRLTELPPIVAGKHGRHTAARSPLCILGCAGHCENHEVCGHFVKANDYLYCKWAVQKFDSGEIESCVQVYKLAADDHVGCHVG
jgi:hypothetical protein